MEDNIQKLANEGQPEDSLIIHAAPGEMVVPPVISEQTQQMINQDLQSVGLNPAEYMVGQGLINPATGLQEFGFLSKLFKKVKKVVKKVAPVALVATGVAGLAGAGPLAGVLGKGAAGKGLGLKGTSGKFFGKGGTFRNILSRGREFILPGEDKKGLFKNIFGGGQQELQQPQFEMILDEDGNPTGMYQEVGIPGSSFSLGELQEAGFIDRAGNFVTPTQQTGPFGGTLGPRLRQTFLGSGDQPGVIGNILSGGQQTGTQTGGGLGLGGAGGIAALAALYGLATKKQAEKTEGGLRDVRLSTRPDLMPQQVFQGFDVGVRPGMSYGGGMGFRELDMRMGGPSEGPGTETSDDIPAMLSDGEFVMTAAANKGLGGFKIEKNKDSLTIFPTGKPDREQGFKNNDMLMKFFEDYQEKVS